MKKWIFLSILFVCQLSIAQNVGIGTNTPQTTLDVKGNQRIGGASKFMTFDSISGKIGWSGANLFVPNAQYLMQHSASSEGLYYGNAQLEYRNAVGNPVFYTNWNDGNGFFQGNVGIGIAAPRAKLHVFTGESGNFLPYSPLVVEGDNNTYINILTPDARESGILFGNDWDAASGGIVYNNTDPFPGNFNGLQFRTNGNVTRMVLNSSGQLGVGNNNPTERVDVNGNVRATDFKYTLPKTQYYSIPGISFHGGRSIDTTFYNLGYGSVTMSHILPGKVLLASIQLPQNAVMTKMTAYIADNSAANNMQILLARKTITSNVFPDNLGFVTSAGSSGVTTAYSTVPFGAPIDNTTYTYYFYVTSQGAGNWTAIVDLVAVVIEYTVTEPD